MLYKHLYKLNSDGITPQSWELHCEGNTYFTISGQVDGKKITSAPTLVIPKAGRTLDEQMTLELNALIKKKTDKKYVSSLEDIHEADGNLPAFSPMLAKKWEDQKKKIKFPCVVQPKLDGVRCLITKDGMFSRSRQRYTSCAHIWEALKPVFEANPETQLDGELYSHDLRHDFEEIISAVRKTAEKATDVDVSNQRKIGFFIYDAPQIGPDKQDASFSRRYIMMKLLEENLNSEHVHVLKTIFGVKSEKEIKKHHDTFVEQGYEGAMVRNTMMPYEGKRTSNLLKVKDFQDAEFEVLGVNEGVGKLVGHAGTFAFQTESGEKFNAKMTGKLERLKWIFQNSSEVIGKMATVRFQNFTEKGVPRFCVVKCVRGLKDRSDWL